MMRLVETIFRTHRPTWDDIIQLLVSLFSTEETHRILTEARKWFREMAPEGSANLQRGAELAAPHERLIETVTQRKGGASWILGGYFTRSQVRGPRTYEYGKTF